MRHEISYEEKYRMMVETPVNRLIPKLAVPTIISMLITSIYNMADTFFVSQLSTSASGAVGVNFSLMAMIQAIGFTLGMGSGNYMSRMLGEKADEKAQRACSTAVYTAFVFGLLLAVFGVWNIDALVRVLGATETIVPFARDYGQYILIAAPYMTVSFVFNNHLRSQGNAALSMMGITTGGVLNVVLDPILIFGFDMGISGAAIATIISQFISFLILLTLVIRSGNVLKPHPKFFTMKWWVYREILSAGMPTLGRQGLASLASVLLNVASSGFGDAAVAAMSIVTRIMMFINSALIGFGQGFQPVCGFNFGAKRYGRVLEAYYFCRKVAFVFLLVMAVVMFAVSTPDWGAGSEDAVRTAAHSVLYHHREYADPVYRLQLPRHADCHREAGAVLYSGNIDFAGMLRNPGAAAVPACCGFADFHPDACDCGDGSERIEGNG